MKTVCVQVIDLIDLIFAEKFSCKKFLPRQMGYEWNYEFPSPYSSAWSFSIFFSKSNWMTSIFLYHPPT